MLQEADFDYRDFDSREAGDKGVYARFFLRPVKDDAASSKEGRPIYYDREYVEIQASGNATNIIMRPVTDMDRQRFRRQYQLFKAGAESQVVGTRLVEVPWITRSQVEELAYHKIVTVEQMAEVNDQFCINVPGMHELKRRAGAYLSQASGSAPITALQKENEDLKSELADLKEAVKQQAGLLEALKAKK